MNIRHMRFLRTTSCLVILSCLFVSCKPTQKTGGHPSSKPEINTVDLSRRFVDACKEKIKGNLELAVNGFNDCLHLDPSMAAAHYELAGLYNSQERNDLALDHAKYAAEADPGNEWYLLLYAQILQETHKPAESAAAYQKLIKLQPEKLDYFYGYSDALLFEGKYKEAIHVYEEIEVKTGPSEDLSLQKAKVYERIGETEKAETEINKLIKDNPGETKYYVTLAQMFQDRADTYKAKGNKAKENEAIEKKHQVYLSLLKTDSANPVAHLALADYYVGRDRYDSAFAEHKAALSNPDLDIDSKVKVALSYYYASEKDSKVKQQCEDLCQIITTLHPTEAKGHAVFADFLYREKRLPEARTEYRKSVENDKSKYVLWNQLLIIDSELNDYTDMAPDSKEAIELFPSMPIPYFFSGLALIQQHTYTEAIDILNSGLIYVVDNKALESQFYSTLGDAFYKTREYTKSDDAYDKALAIDPDNSYVLNNYSYYLSLRNENLEKAEKMAKRANELEPANVNFQDTYAWVLYRLGKYDQALEWMDKVFAVNADPGAVMLEHYGDILFRLNRKDEAFAYWLKAKLKGGNSEMLLKKLADKKLYE